MNESEHDSFWVFLVAIYYSHWVTFIYQVWTFKFFVDY